MSDLISLLLDCGASALSQTIFVVLVFCGSTSCQEWLLASSVPPLLSGWALRQRPSLHPPFVYRFHILVSEWLRSEQEVEAVWCDSKIRAGKNGMAFRGRWHVIIFKPRLCDSPKIPSLLPLPSQWQENKVMHSCSLRIYFDASLINRHNREFNPLESFIVNVKCNASFAFYLYDYQDDTHGTNNKMFLLFLYTNYM